MPCTIVYENLPPAKRCGGARRRKRMKVQPNPGRPMPKSIYGGKANEPSPVVTTDTPKLDAVNSRLEKINVGPGPSPRPLAGAKDAPDAGGQFQP